MGVGFLVTGIQWPGTDFVPVFCASGRVLPSHFMDTRLKQFTISTLFALVWKGKALLLLLWLTNFISSKALSLRTAFLDINLEARWSSEGEIAVDAGGWQTLPTRQGKDLRALATSHLGLPLSLSAPWGNHPERPQSSSWCNRQLLTLALQMFSMGEIKTCPSAGVAIAGKTSSTFQKESHQLS